VKHHVCDDCGAKLDDHTPGAVIGRMRVEVTRVCETQPRCATQRITDSSASHQAELCETCTDRIVQAATKHRRAQEAT
jgi:hypothetical protein